MKLRRLEPPLLLVLRLPRDLPRDLRRVLSTINSKMVGSETKHQTLLKDLGLPPPTVLLVVQRAVLLMLLLRLGLRASRLALGRWERLRRNLLQKRSLTSF
jgi:hypothetical protein